MDKPVNIKNRVIGLEYIKGSELTLNPKNWRTHSDEQAGFLADVISEVGQAGALLAYRSERNGGSVTLIDGHLRTKQWQSSVWPVLMTDLTDDEADYLITVYDPLGAMAGVDAERLGNLAAQFQDDETVMGILTASGIDLSSLFSDDGASGGDGDASPQVDRADELQRVWKVAAGDLWQIGKHRLLCGDSTSPEDVTRLLGGEKPKLMVTDPPYGVEYDPHWRDESLNDEPAIAGEIENDDIIDWSAAYRLAPCDVAYVWHAGKYAAEVQASLAVCDFEVRSQIIWNKQHFAISRGHYHWKHEPCWYAVRKGATASWIGDRTQTTVWDIANLNPFGRTGEDERVAHGTQKPLECMERPLRNHEGDVYDPFTGSGTTMVAAERERRRAYCMELKPEFCAVILQRMKDAFPNLEIKRL